MGLVLVIFLKMIQFQFVLVPNIVKLKDFGDIEFVFIEIQSIWKQVETMNKLQDELALKIDISKTKRNRRGTS